MADKGKNAEIIAILKDPKTFSKATEEIFNLLDTNKSGFIEQSEFKNAMIDLAKKLNAPEPSDAEITQSLNSVDKDKDGKISKKELEDIIKTFCDLMVQNLS